MSRTDLVCALQYGGTPYLYRDDISCARTALEKNNMCFECPSPIPKSVPPLVRYVWRDVMSFCNLYNNHLGQTRTLSCLTFYDIMTSILYRLLHISPLKPETTKGILSAEDVHAAGLLTFIMSIYMPHSSRRVIKYQLISRHIRSAIECMTEDTCNSHSEISTVFWLRMMGCIWTDGDADDEWFMDKLRDIANSLGITSWSQASSVLNQFPWLINFHEGIGMQIWKRLQHFQVS